MKTFLETPPHIINLARELEAEMAALTDKPWQVGGVCSRVYAVKMDRVRKQAMQLAAMLMTFDEEQILALVHRYKNEGALEDFINNNL